MSIADTSPHTTITQSVGPSQANHGSGPVAPTTTKPLHRIRTVRLQQAVALRTVARGRNVSVEQVRREENPASDLSLSTIYHWQHYLEVPVADLLVESQDPLSRPVMERARLVKLMKTIATIRQRAQSDEIRCLADTLFVQAVEIMPELVDVQPWQSIGQRRTRNEVGRIAEHLLPDDFFATLDC